MLQAALDPLTLQLLPAANPIQVLFADAAVTIAAPTLAQLAADEQELSTTAIRANDISSHGFLPLSEYDPPSFGTNTGARRNER